MFLFSASTTFDAYDRAVLDADGEDAAVWLNGLVTCDVTKIASGTAAYGLVVNVKGRILADLYILKTLRGFRLLLPTSEVAELEAYFNRYLVMEDVVLTRSEDRVAFLCGPGVEELTRGAESFATEFLGEKALLVVGDADRIGRTLALGAQLAGDVFDEVRLRRGVPKYGVDFGIDTYPQEAGLEKNAVSFSKGCYLGQEVVCMLEMRGQVRRRLASVQISGREVPAKGAPLTLGGAKVGEVTSAVASGESCIALAMLKVSASDVGTKLELAERTVEVVSPERVNA